jgi:hypothetical protein
VVPTLTVTLRSLLLPLRDRAFIQVMSNADMQLTTRSKRGAGHFADPAVLVLDSPIHVHHWHRSAVVTSPPVGLGKTVICPLTPTPETTQRTLIVRIRSLIASRTPQHSAAPCFRSTVSSTNHQIIHTACSDPEQD